MVKSIGAIYFFIKLPTLGLNHFVSSKSKYSVRQQIITLSSALFPSWSKYPYTKLVFKPLSSKLSKYNITLYLDKEFKFIFKPNYDANLSQDNFRSILVAKFK